MSSQSLKLSQAPSQSLWKITSSKRWQGKGSGTLIPSLGNSEEIPTSRVLRSMKGKRRATSSCMLNMAPRISIGPLSKASSGKKAKANEKGERRKEKGERRKENF